MARNLLISFSGGKSSAYMLKRIWDAYRDRWNIVVVFANTGAEHEETLRFVDTVCRVWGIPVIWVEAVVNPGKVACTHRVVDFGSASRKSRGGAPFYPFEHVIQKYGIPNIAYPHCTRELKLNPITSYLKNQLGWTNYSSAVGIRYDEPKRWGSLPGIVYPMVDWFPTTKAEVNDFWEEQPFTLNLKEHEGNCDACFKKSPAKLVKIALQAPETFDWWAEMERLYGLSGHNVDGRPRTFYREHRTAGQVIEMAQLLKPGIGLFDADIAREMRGYDENTGCSESCEAFAA